ncbi:ABC transporter ATP-binding protein [Luteococcus sp. H138]|uniref:metal ABC transporter ATP-binding protein n=1 Tax=unclassified Luteococcus TaxID=2639923 RepID=UPI00313B92D3
MNHSATPLVEGRDLVVALQGHEILHGVSARVMPGETVALLGGNGSGKTTLVRTLLGLAPVSSGERRLFGTPLERFHDWQRVGHVPQRVTLQLANATVGEVVATGRLGRRGPFIPMRRADRAAIGQALERVQLTELRKAPFLRLSGGQQQRALIARALCTEPELLVLDEPLAGLDMDTQRALAAVLGELKQDGLGILVVLHELGPLEGLIDRSVVLRTGQVIHDGPLLAGPGLGGHHHYTNPQTAPPLPAPRLLAENRPPRENR